MLHYAAHGATVGAVARQAQRLADLTTRYPLRVHAYAADVRDSPAMQQAARAFCAVHGTPDIVIACAGVSSGTLTEHAEDLRVFEAIFDINITGVVKTFQPFVAAMRQRGCGSLVGIASVAGIRGLPGASAYSASKAALINYLEALRIEMRGSGIHVLTIQPGYIKTPMTDVNPYRMPFLVDADQAAAKIARAIARRRSVLTLPWQMSILCRILHVLPRAVFDRLFARAPRKPRQLI